MNRITSFLTHRIFTRYVWFYLAIVLTAAISFWGGIQYAQSTASADPSLQSILNTEIPAWIDEVDRVDGKTLGDPDAPVKVVEYMDIECPYCQRYSRTIFPKIVRDYVKTGKVHYVIKHFPLPKRIHPNAMSGAIAAECAANQNKFWSYKTLAIENREYQSNKTFLALANTISMPDQEQFVQCFEKRREAETVEEELQEGTERGVKGTPTVVIGDETISGVRSYSRYRKAIESVLESGSETS